MHESLSVGYEMLSIAKNDYISFRQSVGVICENYCYNPHCTAIDRWYTLSVLTYTIIRSVIEPTEFITSRVTGTKIEYVFSIFNMKLALYLLE